MKPIYKLQITVSGFYCIFRCESNVDCLVMYMNPHCNVAVYIVTVL